MIPYTLDNIPGLFEKRIFIGGNYDNCAVLREIADIVRELGYQPIIALDFDASKEEVRSYDLRLLSNCKYAIFEISFSDGHLIEIERSGDYKVQALLVYQVRDDKREPPPGASLMVLGTAHPRFGYLDFKELGEYLLTFLPQDRQTIPKTLKIAFNDEDFE